MARQHDDHTDQDSGNTILYCELLSPMEQYYHACICEEIMGTMSEGMHFSTDQRFICRPRRSAR